MSTFSPRPPRPLTLLLALLLTGLLAAAAGAQSAAAYIPCLGCAEHHEIETRWHRPFLVELAGAGFIMFDHFRLERDARDLGLCETDVLLRSSRAVNGCHRYSALRAWLIEAPIEIAAFTSPAWGLERRGHPRWAMALESVPMIYHGLALRSTIQAIHQWQRLSYLLH
ncbi:MAG: hypothetical protein ACRD1C_10020 [Terriglobales bacterium]